MLSLQDISKEINSMAGQYDIGSLQNIRKKIGGLKRLPSSFLFDYRTVHKEWGWHYGGRKELQFNIGIEGSEKKELRYGVAFSLECSQTLPDINFLVPKIELFNEYISEYGNKLSDLKMWHFQNGKRVGDYMPSPIPPENVRENMFIFLGQKQSRDCIDYKLVLETFDRLLPLYLFIEGFLVDREINGKAEASGKEFRFVAGCPKRLSSTSGNITEKKLNIRLKHNDLQFKLYKNLSCLYGEGNVGAEIKANDGSVDLVVKQGEKYWFYEIKTASTAKACIRQALGQVMEYAFWPGNHEVERIIIVGEPKASEVEKKYIDLLNDRFRLPVEYQSI